MKLDDEIVEVKEWDVVRVPPGTWRGYEGGPEGLEILVFGAPNLGEIRAETWRAGAPAGATCRDSVGRQQRQVEQGAVGIGVRQAALNGSRPTARRFTKAEERHRQAVQVFAPWWPLRRMRRRP